MTEDSDGRWWQGDGGDLQGVPNAPASAPQQIFVSKGQGMPVPQSTSAMIINRYNQTNAIVSPIEIHPIILAAFANP